MKRRSAMLTGSAIGSVVSCALLGMTSGSAVAARQDTAAALAGTATTVVLATPTVSYENEQAEVFSVSVTSSQGTPTGTVTITALNGSVACTATLANGTAACPAPPRWGFPATVTVLATYSGDSSFAPSTSATQAFTIVKDSTSTSLSISPATLTYGDEQVGGVTVVVTAPGVTSLFDNGPSGNVEITLPVSVVTGVESYNPVSWLMFGALSYPAGVTEVTATYLGNSNFLSSTSPAVTLRINKATTKTLLTLRATKITYGAEQAERLSVKVSPQYAGTPGGRVTIKHGTAVVCTITLAAGTGSCVLGARTLPIGTDHLIASYAGNADFTGSATAPVAVTVIR